MYAFIAINFLTHKYNLIIHHKKLEKDRQIKNKESKKKKN
jgi:hypothetical protein